MEIKWHDYVSELKHRAENQLDQPIIINVTKDPMHDESTISNEQVKQVQSLKPQELHIEITGSLDAAINVLAAHELLHVLNQTKLPQIAFPVHFVKETMTNQAQLVAKYLYEIVEHVSLYHELEKHGLLTPEIKQKYVNGLLEDLPKESSTTESMNLFRVLKLTDLLVLGSPQSVIIKENYPVSLQLAEELSEIVMTVGTELNPRLFHQTLIKVYRKFDEITQKLGFMPFKLNDFVQVENIYSERQLRLAVNHFFTIVHSDLLGKNNLPAYLGMDKQTEQLSFVLQDNKKFTPELFQTLYQEKVADFFAQNKINYIKR